MKKTILLVLVLMVMVGASCNRPPRVMYYTQSVQEELGTNVLELNQKDVKVEEIFINGKRLTAWMQPGDFIVLPFTVMPGDMIRVGISK